MRSFTDPATDTQNPQYPGANSPVGLSAVIETRKSYPARECWVANDGSSSDSGYWQTVSPTLLAGSLTRTHAHARRRASTSSGR